jgi:hypothetical protein
MTHLGSGWEKIASLLEEYPHIHVFQTDRSYGHPDDVLSLLNENHRRKSSAAIWGDVVFYNKDWTMKRLVSYYKFIFWSCPLENCINELVSKHKYKTNNAENYWKYRMEGLKQYHKRTPNSLWNPELNREIVLRTVLG